MNVAELVHKGGSPTRMVLRCLGRFHLEDQSGNQLQLRTRKARAVLAALALNGRPMSRDSLADLLWSDRGEVQARSSLRQTIFELQHFGSEDAPVLSVGRDEVSIRGESVVTDIALIRAASADGDWARLLALFGGDAPGLLTDLDGLDPQFDDWLRIQRAHEPERSMAAAVGAVERCHSEAGPRAALELVTAILRIVPANEEATRHAMRLSHELGDQVAVHRHFGALRDRLHDDYDATPSLETLELLSRLANGHGKSEQSKEAPGAGLYNSKKERRAWPLALAALLAVLAIGAALGAFLRSGPAPRPETISVAVLPFDQHPADDGFIAAGLWEQTRAALTRNTAVRVLGRTTTEVMVQQKLAPEQFLKRFGVTHLLEGNVRRSGGQLLVSVSLTRTSDGITVWHDLFRGQMGAPFALQDAIANGIEGKLRARLAPGGGRHAEQIGTTPEVAALYSEARQLISSRERAAFRRAEALLREAVKADPNYAPAWSLLGAAIFFNGRLAIVDGEARREGIAATQRALSMAPNFAPAHATMALLQGEASPEAELQLRKAVALDPNYSEAWNWLGNSLLSQGQHRQAIQAYRNALAIDPLLQPAVLNLSMVANEMRDQATLDWLSRTIMTAGASGELITSVEVERAYQRRDYSAGLKLLTNRGVDESGKPKRLLWSSWFESLTALGFYDALHRVTGCPDWYAPLVSGKALPPRVSEGKPVTSEEFWTSIFFSTPAARSMVNLGRSKELVDLYRAGFRNADDFVSQTERRDMLPELAANVAVALRAQGQTTEADYLLSTASARLENSMKGSPTKSGSGRLALVRAAQGERNRAAALLEQALANQWLPDGHTITLDIAQEPGFRALRGDPRFEAARKRILGHIARERAELGPLEV